MIPPVLALALVTFASPFLLWGALAVAAPVLIHLILRPKPRRQPFPALRFILQSHEAAERTNRLKRLLLLLMRIAAVAAVAALLAQPRLRAVRWVPTGSSPVSVAICIDDSASMGYRFEGKTRVDAAKDWAIALVSDRSRFGEGSEFVVLTNRVAGPIDTLTTSRSAARQRIDAIRDGGHDLPVGQMIRMADQMLSSARHPHREIYLFTDATARAWRDTSESPTAPASGASVFCIDVGAHEDANLSLMLAPIPQRTVAIDAAPELEFTARAGPDRTGTAVSGIEVCIDGEPRVRQELSPVPPGESVTGTVRLPALAAGLHRVTVALSPSDPLPSDNVRYSALYVGHLPRVAVIGGTSAAPAHTSASRLLIAAMLAPPSLPPDRQHVECELKGAGDAEAADWSAFRCVFVADGAGITPGTWRRLTDYAQGGGWVVLVLGPAATADDCRPGGDLLPALPEEVTTFDPPARVEAPDTRHPLLRPFASPGVDSIGDRRVFRAWRLGKPAEHAAVLCKLTNGQPAILERPVGKGRCFLLTVSPDPDWSEFGTQAAPLILLLHRIVELASPTTERCSVVTVGSPKSARLPLGEEANPGPLVEVFTPHESDRSRSRPVASAEPAATVALGTDEPGHVWLASRNSPQTPLFLCAVDVDEAESDLRTLSPEQIAAKLPSGHATYASSPEELHRIQRRQRIGIDAVLPLGVVLLALLIAESFFANRFYRRAPAPPTPANRPLSGR